MKTKTKKQKGFTLIELVVIAGIILLLISIILSRLDVSREKARDTKKVSELKTLQTALELYQLDIGQYPHPDDFVGVVQPARNSNSENTLSITLQGIVNAGYLSSIPVPPRGSSVAGGDRYFYQTKNVTGYEPDCDGKRLGEVPYIIYFVTEQPRNLPVLTLNGGPIENGHCLTL